MQTDKIIFILVMILSLATSQLVWATDVAVILSRQAGPYKEALQGFQAQAQFSYRIFDMEGDKGKGERIISDISRADYQAVVTIGSEACLIAQSLSPSIDLVYSMVLAPIYFNNRSVSGVHITIDIATQLKTIKRILPGRSKIGVIYSLQDSKEEVIKARKIADKEGLQLFPIAVQSREGIPNALTKMNKSSVDIIWMIADATVGHPESVKLFIAHAEKEYLPFIGFSVFHVKAGALAAFTINFGDIGKQTATLVSKVSKGNVKNRHEGPQQTIIYVNAKMQKQLGLAGLSMYPDVQIIQ